MLSTGLAMNAIRPGASGLHNTHAYRFYRLNGTAATAGAVGIDQFAIAATPGGADTTGGKTATANTTFSTFVPANAIDATVGTFWISTALPGILTVDYGVTAGNWIAANEFRITVRNDAGFDEAPTAFTLDGSDDNASWTALVTKSGLTWSSGETKTFAV